VPSPERLNSTRTGRGPATHALTVPGNCAVTKRFHPLRQTVPPCGFHWPAMLSRWFGLVPNYAAACLCYRRAVSGCIRATTSITRFALDQWPAGRSWMEKTNAGPPPERPSRGRQPAGQAYRARSGCPADAASHDPPMDQRGSAKTCAGPGRVDGPIRIRASNGLVWPCGLRPP